MDIITHGQLRSLAQSGTPPCVSLFLPTHRQGRDTRQDPVHLKNLLRHAEVQLEQRGMRGTEARDLLEPARRLLDDLDFWQHNENGLAIYVCPEFFRLYRVPIELNDESIVNDHFEVKPLLPLLEGHLFYILAFSNDTVRLLQCTERTLKQMKLPDDVATSYEDAIGGEQEHQTHVLRHAGDASNAFSGAGSYHGQATDVQRNEHEDLLFYYRQLDDGVMRTIKEQDAPLVLAGVDSRTPFYRQVSAHKHIHAEPINGNPEHVSNEELHKKALTLLEPLWKSELNQLQEQFGNAIAHQLASTEVEEIIPAAATGRVGILFVAPQSSHWGRVDPSTKQVMEDGQSEGAEDLIDRAAIETLLTSGQVVVVEPDQIPGNGELAAIYRY